MSAPSTVDVSAHADAKGCVSPGLCDSKGCQGYCNYLLSQRRGAQVVATVEPRMAWYVVEGDEVRADNEWRRVRHVGHQEFGHVACLTYADGGHSTFFGGKFLLCHPRGVA